MLVAPAHSIHVDRWARYLTGRGHALIVVSDTEMREPLPGVAILDLGWKWLPRPVRFALGVNIMRRAIRAFRPDIVHVHSLGSNVVLANAVPSRFLVVTPWGSDISLLSDHSLRLFLVQRALRRATHVLTTSDHMRMTVIEKFGVNPERVKKLSWGIDRAIFHPAPSPEARRSERRRWSIPDEAFVIFANRTSSPVYRTLELSNAFKQALKSRPELYLVILCGFTPSNTNAAKLQTSYQDRVNDVITSVASHATVIDRVLTPPEIASLLRACDVAVSIPSNDQRSSSVLEAIASGVQVVLTDIPVYRELQTDGARVLFVNEPIETQLAGLLGVISAPHEQDRSDNEEFIKLHEVWQSQAELVEQIYFDLVK